MPQTRRTVLAAFLSASALPVLGARIAGAQVETRTGPRLEPTPACGDDHEATPSQTEGPFFEPGAPLRHDLAADAPDGDAITIAGFVLDRECRPVPGAMVQIWHADEKGRYDNAGYRLRGHQPADDRGRWWFSTIVPAGYPGRTRHYHFKVAKPGGRVLTTQLYFPGEPLNRRDRIFDERLLLRMEDAADGRFGRFDFVV
jgi:protocatechuate 3,4-dioxygenase beta subunit